MKHAIFIFSPAGDTVMAEWETDNAEQIAFAEGVFNQAREEGWAAVAETPTGAEAVDKFQKSLGKIYLLRPIAGG